jgi:hypothetical protein
MINRSFCSKSKWGLPYDEDHIRNMPLEDLKDALMSGSNKVRENVFFVSVLIFIFSVCASL